MHKANGSSERSTHAAHSVPIDPMDGKSIAFPYTVVGESEKIQYLRPGSHLSGIMIDANDEYITLKVDGRKIRIATSTPSQDGRTERRSFSSIRLYASPIK